MHWIAHFVQSAALLGAISLGLSAVPVHAASHGGPQISQAYYLFYRLDRSIHANCIQQGNAYIAGRGTASLRPYRIYQIVGDGSATNGIFSTTYTLQDGFSTAVVDLYCRYGDFAYEYFGDHKVQRKETFVQVCYGMSCQPVIWFYSPWKGTFW